ncbi:hypothetical protein [Micromonospora sp. C32]|nr:hypothetical protein [Micromonospora sp. C32]
MLLLQQQGGGEIEEEAKDLRLWDGSGIELATGRNYANTGEVDF